MVHKATNFENEPSSEPLHISAKYSYGILKPNPHRSEYSVTALEMAHAWLRRPNGAEAFFFLRNKEFMEDKVHPLLLLYTHHMC